jgi:mannose-1-phosphate guanylyltransferase
MQALILAGGEGTRLRPLTSAVPKLVVPLVDRPFIAYMLEWLRGHGVDDVIFSCGFLADGVRAVLGDGSGYGVRLRYVEEPEPLGTGGALKLAEELLDERFLMLNGDVLTDLDVTAQLELHAARGARATLALTPVEDPSAYGLVRTRPDGEVTGFVEKPAPEQIDTRNISAGIYVLERSILGLLEPGRRASIERDVFPRLVGAGLYAFVGEGYWLDIGTPERYLQGTADILAGTVRSGVEAGGALIAPDASVAADATIGAGVVLGAGVTVGAGSSVERAVVLHGAVVGAGCVLRDCVVAAGARIGDGTRIEGFSMLGEGVRVGAGNVVAHGARLFPGVDLPDGGLLF